MTRENMQRLPNRVFTVAETAEILRCSEGFVRRILNCGLMRYMKIGDIKIRSEALDEFLEKFDGEDVTTILKNMEEEDE